MFDDEIEKLTNRALHELADFALEEAKRQVPVASGKLKKTIRIKWSKKSFEIIFGDESTYLPEYGFGYEYLVVNGTAPHIITAKNAKVLTNGKSFFGKTVNHTGTKANPFDVRTYQAVLNKLNQISNASTNLSQRYKKTN